MAEQMAARQRSDVRDYVDRAMQQQPNAYESSSQGSRSEGSFQTGTVHPALARRALRVSEDGVRDVGVPAVGGIELWRARARIKELTQAMMGKKSFSKSKTRRCLKNLPETDRNNVVTVYNWIDGKMWSKNHIRGPKMVKVHFKSEINVSGNSSLWHINSCRNYRVGLLDNNDGVGS